MKVCSRCGQEKGLQDFNRSKHGRLGRRGECKTCSSFLTSLRRNHANPVGLGRKPHHVPEDWKIDREMLAWGAGFYEGEGSITTQFRRRNRNFASVKINIKQVNREPLERFQGITGGMGKIAGPLYIKNPPNRRPIYSLQLWTYESVQATIAMLWPWLSQVRKKQAASALLAFRHSLTGTHGARWRIELSERMRMVVP